MLIVRPSTCQEKWKNTKALVFQSDDWGYCGYMPNQSTYDLFRDSLVEKNGSRELIFGTGTLETPGNMERLFTVLEKYNDSEGRHPVFQAGYVMANPDYEAIKKNNFEKYIDVPLPKFPSCWQRGDIVGKALEGVERKIWLPIYHGASHFNTGRWMRRLQCDEDVKNFALRGCFLGEGTSSDFEFGARDDIGTSVKQLEKGLDIFQQVFGQKANTMIFPSYVWPMSIERELGRLGISILEGKNCQWRDQGLFERVRGKLFNFMGLKDAAKLWQIESGDYRPNLNLNYVIRNVFFEPTLESMGKGKSIDEIVSHGVAQIENAWSSGQPAVIISHRLNYVGLNAQEVEKGLICLDTLLSQIVSHYPDVDFLLDSDLVCGASKRN